MGIKGEIIMYDVTGVSLPTTGAGLSLIGIGTWGHNITLGVLLLATGLVLFGIGRFLLNDS